MKILVTGATTQTGTLAVRALRREGHRVRCLLHSPHKRDLLPREGVEIVHGDLERPETLRSALEGIECLVQVAHIRFAPQVIGACEAAGVRRAIFFSSTRRYTKFDCPSARQVRAGEEAIGASSLDYTILRPSMIHGSRRDRNISRLIAYLERHKVFPLIGSGGNLVQPVYVLDLVEALLEALKRPAAVRSAYTLAGAHPLTYRQMVETIARALGRRVAFLKVPLRPTLYLARLYEKLSSRPRITSEQVLRMAEDRAFDISAARRDLDFRPLGFEEAVRRQIAGEIEALLTSEQSPLA